MQYINTLYNSLYTVHTRPDLNCSQLIVYWPVSQLAHTHTHTHTPHIVCLTYKSTHHCTQLSTPVHLYSKHAMIEFTCKTADFKFITTYHKITPYVGLQLKEFNLTKKKIEIEPNLYLIYLCFFKLYPK